MFNPLKPFQKSDDGIFSLLIKEEFLKDLEFISSLIFISERDIEKISIKESFLDSFRQKYSHPEVSHLYKYASKHLREEYDEIHNKINRILWLDSLRTSHNPRSRAYQYAYKLLRKELSQVVYS